MSPTSPQSLLVPNNVTWKWPLDSPLKSSLTDSNRSLMDTIVFFAVKCLHWDTVTQHLFGCFCLYTYTVYVLIGYTLFFLWLYAGYTTFFQREIQRFDSFSICESTQTGWSTYPLRYPPEITPYEGLINHWFPLVRPWQTLVSERGTFGGVQENCNTPVEHTPGNPPTQLWKESLYGLLVKV